MGFKSETRPEFGNRTFASVEFRPKNPSERKRQHVTGIVSAGAGAMRATMTTCLDVTQFCVLQKCLRCVIDVMPENRDDLLRRVLVASRFGPASSTGLLGAVWEHSDSVDTYLGRGSECWEWDLPTMLTKTGAALRNAMPVAPAQRPATRPRPLIRCPQSFHTVGAICVCLAPDKSAASTSFPVDPNSVEHCLVLYCRNTRARHFSRLVLSCTSLATPTRACGTCVG